VGEGDGVALGLELGLGLALGLGLGLGLALALGLGDGETLGEADGLGEGVLAARLGPPPKGAGAVGLVVAKATIRTAAAATASPTGSMAVEERASISIPPLFWAERR
jgi:hypothetical protein